MKDGLVKFTRLLLAFCLIWGCAVWNTGIRQADAATTNYYVDPVNGNDANSGTSPGSAFLTIEAARDAVRLVNGAMTDDIVVYLMPGNYWITDTIAFDGRDSGSGGKTIIWRNYGGKGSAKLIGGQSVTGWTTVSGSVYKASVGTGLNVKYIYENGVRGVPARHPNNGFYKIDSNDQLYKQFRWKSTDSIPTIVGKTDLEVEVWPGNHDWSNLYRGVASMNYGIRQITLSTPIPNGYLGGLVAGSRFRLMGALELLDQPGEFYYDSANGDLYYMPSDRSMANKEIIVPRVVSLLDFYGDSGNSLDELVGHWKFERIDDETNTTDDESVKQNHATVHGATYTSGKTAELGNALRLDGTDDYASVAYDASLTFAAPATAMTMSAWIRTTGTGFQPVLSKARDVNTANIDYRFGLDDHGKLELHRWNQSSSGGREAVLDSDGTALNDGEWHPIAFVYENASAHKLYVDGQLAETSTVPWQYNDSNTQEVNIGRYKNASAFTYYFAGDIDEVRIVRSALQAGEIQDLYDGKEIVPPPALQNIVIEGLSFEATNLNHADEIGIRQGQISVTAAKNITIRNNEFARGGGSGVYVDASDSITIEGNDVFDMGMAGILVSRSGKASTDSKVTNNRVNNTGQAFADWGGNIALKASDHMEVSYNQLSTSARHGVTLRSSNDNTIKFNEISDMNRNSQDTGAIYYGQSENIAVENNRVHHSGKFGRGQTGIYVEDNSNNSTLRNNIVYSILASETNNLNTSVIAKGEKTAFYNNIFDYSTSYAAIRSLAFNGYTVNLHKFEHNIFASFGSQRRHFNFVNYSNDRVDQSDYNLFYKQASGSHQMIGIPGDDTLANWKTLRSNRYDQHSTTGDPMFVDRANGDYTLQASSPALTSLGFQQIDQRSIGLKSEFVYPGTKGQWVFGGDAADVSMSGRDGATHGGAAYATDRFGKTTSGLSLDGATGYVGIAHDSALTFGDPAKPFTVSAWINTSASGVQAFVAKSRTNSGSSPIDYQFGLDAAGYLQLSRWNADPEDAEQIANNSLPLNDGKWHHIAFVNESASSHKLYADGQLLESSTASWTHDYSSTEPVEIGRYANAGAADQYFDGQIDDVSILQRAMSEREIKELNHIPLAPLVP